MTSNENENSNSTPDKSKKKVRSYCFTINNYRDEDIEALRSLASTQAQYICWGKEVAPSTGTPHLQGYVYWKSQKTFDVTRKLIRGNIEICKGNAKQNIDYCSKDKQFEEHGSPPKTPAEGGAMEKDRWALARENCAKRQFELIPDDIYIKHYSACKRIAAESQILLPPLDTVCGYWLYGPAGTGKSSFARAIAPLAYIKKANNKWWDGYQYQDDVIIEDLDLTHHYMAHDLKIWADKFSFPAEVKGSSMEIRPKRVIVTSNYSPRDIWIVNCDKPENEGLLNPILDRYVLQQFSGSTYRVPRGPLVLDETQKQTLLEMINKPNS